MEKGYKHTEVGVIPEDWEVKELGDVCDITSSKRIFESDYVNIGIPFYRGKEISLLNENKKLEEEYFISVEKYEAIKKTFGVPTKGDILITAVGTLGNVYLVPNNDKFYFKDGNLIWLRSIKNVLSDYLSIQLNWLRKEILNNAIGSSQKALTIVVLKKQFIPLPPLAEQRAIATVLSDADALIQKLEQLIAKKRNIKTAAMQELLKPKKGWEVKKLGEIGEIITGGTPPTNNKEYWNGNIPWITPTDISTHKNIYHSEREITPKGLSLLRRLPKNSLLVTCIASIGKNAILRNDGACNQQINAIIPSTNYDVDFLYYLIEINKNILIGSAGITATLILSKKEFSEIEFSFPKQKEEQTRIAQILSDMDNEIQELEKQLEKYKMIKQGMMQCLLTGKKRLNYDFCD